MILPAWFVYVAIAIRLISGAVYTTATMKGKAKPSPVTWFFWGLTPMIAFAAQVSRGGGIESSLMTFAIGLGPLVIFITAFFKNRKNWKFTISNGVCAILAAIGVALWLITDDPVLAMIFSILADFSASLPTITKSYLKPKSEYPVAYAISMLSMILTLLALSDWSFLNYAFEAYILVINLIILSAICIGHLRDNK